MNTIIKLALVATLAIFAQNIQAQDDPVSIERQLKDEQDQIEYLKKKKQLLIDGEKESLKRRVTYINRLVSEGEITEAEAIQKKKEYAEKVALNIENETAIIDNQIALVERNGSINSNVGSQVVLGFGAEDGEGKKIYGVSINDGKVKNVQYDRRTYGETVIAIGLNNAVSDNSEIGDDFTIGGSRFFEFGHAWKTRVFKNSGALQFKYGWSVQSNKVSYKRNETLVVENDQASFQEFPLELRKAQLRTTNLVIPLHLEFGGWKKEQGEDYVRYRIGGKFRMAVGVYGGVRLATQQKLKYRENGERVKIKNRQDFGGDNFVFGLSSYVRITGDLSLYGKYDLTNSLNTTGLGDVNNVSLGLRLDL